MLVQLVSLATLFYAASAPSNSFTVEARYIHGQQTKLIGKAVVRNSHSAKLSDLWQEPFVTSVELEGTGVPPNAPYSATKPTIDILNEGVDLEVKVTERDLRAITRSKVFLDVTARISEIGRVDTKILDDHPAADTTGNAYGTFVQTPQQATRELRVLTPVTIGKPIKISIDDRTHESVEITVRRQAGGWGFGIGGFDRHAGKAQSAKSDRTPYSRPQG